MFRSKECGEINLQHINESVTIAGWVHRRRDHGGLIFIDLRDSKGIVQVVINPENGTSPGPYKIYKINIEEGNETIDKDFEEAIQKRLERALDNPLSG